jgi:hypothetical protein
MEALHLSIVVEIFAPDFWDIQIICLVFVLGTIIPAQLSPVLSAYNAQTSLLLDRFTIVRGDCAFCAPCINEESNLFLIEQCSLRIMNFEVGRNVFFPLPERPTDIRAIAATTDRIALARVAGPIVICTFDLSALFASGLIWSTGATSLYPAMRL